MGRARADRAAQGGAHLSDWLEERRFYHRKDGQIVKIKDDLLSATRVALMMKRYAKAGAGARDDGPHRLARCLLAARGCG
jgi:hypothetical protein